MPELDQTRSRSSPRPFLNSADCSFAMHLQRRHVSELSHEKHEIFPAVLPLRVYPVILGQSAVDGFHCDHLG